MDYSNFAGFFITGVVAYLLVRLLGPKPSFRLRVERRTKRRSKKRVRVDPLLLKERRLVAELQEVRQQMRDHHRLN